jgi:hypothetical protein
MGIKRDYTIKSIQLRIEMLKKCKSTHEYETQQVETELDVLEWVLGMLK